MRETPKIEGTGDELIAEHSDEDLMRAYQKGEQGAFEELFNRYGSRMECFLKKRLHPSRQSDSSDLIQLSWLKVHQTRQRFDASRKFSSWFYGIVMNTLRDYYKQARWRYEIQEVDDFRNTSMEEGTEEERLVRREQIEQLGSAFEGLSEVQRDILLLSDWEGFRSKEIAKILELSDANVRQQLFRARQFLRSEVKA